jgi:hypothetical protein
LWKTADGSGCGKLSRASPGGKSTDEAAFMHSPEGFPHRKNSHEETDFGSIDRHPHYYYHYYNDIPVSYSQIS